MNVSFINQKSHTERRGGGGLYKKKNIYLKNKEK